jgi:hypothetical protein
LNFNIKELVPDIGCAPVPGGSPGEVNNIQSADISLTLVPVGPGSSMTGTCIRGVVSGTGYDRMLPVSFTFTGVPVNTFAVQISVGGKHYTASYADVVTVYDPSLIGFTTGGGHFLWPGTTDRTSFGYTIKYNKKGSAPQGSLMLVRHRSDGGVNKVKSNALSTLAISTTTDGTGTWGWASFSGKATYTGPDAPLGIGNQSWSAYVEDHNEPGSGVDKFWINVSGRPALALPTPSAANALPITNGNIVVPHTRAN